MKLKNKKKPYNAFDHLEFGDFPATVAMRVIKENIAKRRDKQRKLHIGKM
jgi:hypothetical protein